MNDTRTKDTYARKSGKTLNQKMDRTGSIAYHVDGLVVGRIAQVSAIHLNSNRYHLPHCITVSHSYPFHQLLSRHCKRGFW